MRIYQFKEKAVGSRKMRIREFKKKIYGFEKYENMELRKLRFDENIYQVKAMDSRRRN